MALNDQVQADLDTKFDKVKNNAATIALHTTNTGAGVGPWGTAAKNKLMYSDEVYTFRNANVMRLIPDNTFAWLIFKKRNSILGNLEKLSELQIALQEVAQNKVGTNDYTTLEEDDVTDELGAHVWAWDAFGNDLEWAVSASAETKRVLQKTHGTLMKWREALPDGANMKITKAKIRNSLGAQGDDPWRRLGTELQWAGSDNESETAARRNINKLRNLPGAGGGGFGGAVGRARVVTGEVGGPGHHHTVTDMAATNAHLQAERYDLNATREGVGGRGHLKVVGRARNNYPHGGYTAKQKWRNTYPAGAATMQFTDVAGDKITPRARGVTQQAAMSDSSANAVADAQIQDNNRQWEWLHIRGAALGGVTDDSNLVLGLRDVNTSMMPFEQHIGTIAGWGDTAKATDFNASFKAYTPVAAEHGGKIYEDIKLSWTYKVLGVQRDGYVAFKPLDKTGVASRDGIGVLEADLRNARDAM